MSSQDDDYLIEREGDLILDSMGVGTFIFIFMTIVFVMVWSFSTCCEVGTKVATRVVYALIYMITMLILIFAPREDAYINASFTDNVYDHSIIPRIAISLVLMIFAIVAGVFGVQQLAETKTLSSTEQEFNELWVDGSED